jgi:hypothetical protein
MTDFPIEILDLTDFQADRLDNIALSDQQVTQAQTAAQTAPHPWQTYLSTLADCGFGQWLDDRAGNMAVQQVAAGIWSVNGFRVATIASTDEEEVLLPQHYRDRAAAACHLYVAIGIVEEQQQAYIMGSLRHDQLAQQQWEAVDQDYVLPLDRLAASTNQLLLTLRCGDPASIPLPTTVSQSITQTTNQVAHTLQRSVINVRRWLDRQLDQAATELSWVLMPPLAATAMRSQSNGDPLSKILPTLTQQGIVIPASAQSAYQDLSNPNNPSLRLYAVVGAASATEWSLLLVLGQIDGEALPATLKLSIGDGQTTLVEQQVEVARSQAYLYAQVIGDLAEGFQVTVTWPDGKCEQLPEFVFQA